MTVCLREYNTLTAIFRPWSNILITFITRLGLNLIHDLSSLAHTFLRTIHAFAIVFSFQIYAKWSCGQPVCDSQRVVLHVFQDIEKIDGSLKHISEQNLQVTLNAPQNLHEMSPSSFGWTFGSLQLQRLKVWVILCSNTLSLL